MDEDWILRTDDGSVSVLTLNRPDRFNALVPEMVRAYVQALREADADPDVRVIVVTGAGKGFCSGADLSILAQGPENLDRFVDGFSTDDMFTAAMSLGTPVAMAVNGAAAGVGMVLALSGDVRFAASGASFISAFTRLGLTAEYGIAWLLPRLVGEGRAREILLSGRPVAAEEALRIGLVDAVSDDALATALSWAHDVAAHCSPSAMATMKGQLRRSAEQSLPQQLTESLALMSQSFRWPDLAEAMTARAEKRAPDFPPRHG